MCGDVAWQWVYLLLDAPQWVQERGWFANWFIVVCDACHEAWGDDEALRVRWDLNDAHADPGRVPDFDEYRRVVAAMQSEPPLSRVQATVG